MDNPSRKATDVLLEMEAKINALLALVRTQDLNIKVLSNKLNALMEKMENQPATSASLPPKITIEAIQNSGFPGFNTPPNENELLFNPDYKLEIDNSPKGFRRTSRPETYSGDDAYLKKSATPPPVNNKAEIIVPPGTDKIMSPPAFKPKQNTGIVQNAIPVQQRVVDGNGKSIFLAEVEILDISNGTSLPKIKTNGTGKWSMALPVGNYKVFIRKRGSSTKDKVEIVQDIQIDGKQSPFDLPMIIVK